MYRLISRNSLLTCCGVLSIIALALAVPRALKPSH
jgi:hypothetical protein